MKKLIYLNSTWCYLFLLLLAGGPAMGQVKTLTKDQYRDKTLAMVLGTVGGVYTGYEYLNVYNTPNGYYQTGATMKTPKEPLLGMPDSWFILLNGTLGGTTKDEYNYGSWYSPGRSNSDDDQHIDFFNQYLLNQYGPSISYEDIKKEWMAKQVSDFGAGQGAIEVMRDKNLMAPQSGNRDHGNTGHWLAEGYIEHETMGAAFPGMPNKSAQYTERFSQLTCQGENVQWGYYWSAAHAIGFFETDIRVVAQKALAVLPANCRPRQMYDICVALQAKYPNDWRAAVKELWKNDWSGPFAVGYDGVTLVSDANNGTGLLAILYGNNDYLTTLKIAALAGGDGDCTASTVGGLLGVIKGMAGTPAAFKDNLYQNGKGLWINDVKNAFSIKKDFKLEWKFDEIVDMYQQNAEAMIRANGGVVSSTGYSINTQSAVISQIPTTNWGFEEGTLNGWKTWTSGGTSSIWCEKQCDDNTLACMAATGKYKGTILTNSATAEAKLYQTVTGLKPGATYKIEGRIHTASGRVARLYVDNYGGAYKYTSIYKGVSPFPYLHLYVTMGATNTTLDVGLHAPASSNSGTWCNIDDIIITEIENPVTPVRYEAENAIVNGAVINTNENASGGKYVGSIDVASSYIEFQNVMADYSGEYIVRINIANAGDFATHKITVNGVFVGLLEHSDTGPWGVFSANITDAYVKLNKGANTIRISQNTNFAEIDYIELLSPYNGDGKPADGESLVDGGIYKIIAKHSDKVLDINGTAANGTFIVQNTFTGAQSQYFKINKIAGLCYLTPVSNPALSLEIIGAGTNNGDKVDLWGYWSGDNQQWAIIDAGNGYFKIINNRSGKVIDVSGGSTADGATVFQYDDLNANNQKWRFDFVGLTADDIPLVIPGKIEAEKYSSMSGVQTQATNDADGGLNVGWIETGDWMDYHVSVGTAGAYTVDYRIASIAAGGQVQLKSGNAVLATTNLPNSGGWQTWITASTTVNLNAGDQILRIYASSGGFNLNWVNFQKKVITNISPVVSFTAPLNNAVYTIPASVNFSVNASDADGTVSKVEFFNGTTLVSTDVAAPYTFSMNNMAIGIYTLKAVATDNAGATGTATITITVKDSATIINQVPVVTIASPSNGASYTAPASVTIAVNATDADGSISKVEFYSGSTLLNSDLSSPYAFAWTSVAAGSYTITVKATDNLGATGTAAISFVVKPAANQIPTLSILTPVTGSSFTAPASVTINANAADDDGSIAKVEFYNGANLLGSDLASPYSFVWNNVAAGNYTINVTATDDQGATTTKAVSIVVSSVATTVGINGPACVTAGGTYTYTVNPENTATNTSWWSNSAATVSPVAADPKKITIQIPEFMDGNTFTIYSGNNFSVSPWYKEYTKSIKVGGCANSRTSAVTSPQPFDNETTVSLEDGQALVSVSVFDTKGTLLYSKQNIMLTEFTLGSELSAGIYILQVQSESGLSVTRMIKNK